MSQSVKMPDGTTNVFPDEATPEMISKALGLNNQKPVDAAPPVPSPSQATNTPAPEPILPPPTAPTGQTPPAVPLTDDRNPNGTDRVSPPDPVNDKIFQQTQAGATLSKIDSWMGLGWTTMPGEAMFKAASNAWNDPGDLGLSPETVEGLRQKGLFENYAKNETDWGKAVTEAVLKPAAIVGDAAFRAVNAVATGVLAFGSGLLNEAESKLGAAKESSETVAHGAEDFTNYLYITAGFAADGMPNVINKASAAEKTAAPAEAATASEKAAPQSVVIPVAKDTVIPDKAGNINLNNLILPKDAKNAIWQTAEDNGGANSFLDQRRGTVSHSQTIEDGQKLVDQSAAGIPEWLANWPVGKAPNNAESTAARTLLAQSSMAVVKAAKLAQESGAESDALAWEEANRQHVLIQRTVSGMAAEAGRGLNAFGIKVSGGEEAEALAQLENKGLTREDLLATQAGMESGQQAVKLLEDVKKPSFADMGIYYIMNNYLSGPITHAAYAASYFAQSFIRAGIETPMASAIGAVQRKLGRGIGADAINSLAAEKQTLVSRIADAENGGKFLKVADREVMKDRIAAIDRVVKSKATVMPKETAARFYGMGQGALDATVATWKSLKSGVFGKLPGEGDMPFTNRNPIVAFGKGLQNPVLSSIVQGVGHIDGIPMRVVGAIHTFQKFFTYSESMNALAYRQSALEGLKGSIGNTATALGSRMAELKNNPSTKMMQTAVDEAKYSALMGEPGNAGKKFEEWAHSNVYTRALVPFSRVMNNINSQVFLERNPIFGWLSKSVREDIMGKNGNVPQALAISKMGTGTIVLTGAATLAGHGYITGAPADDPKERDYNFLAGNPPYSVRFGDTNIPMRFFGIPGRVLAIGADLHNASQAFAAEGIDAAIGKAAHDIGNNVLSESGFRGIAELYQAVNDYKRYGKQYAQNTLASALMPMSIGQGQISRFNDPIMRQAHGIVETLQSRTPGLSTQRVPKIDIFGNPLQRSGDHDWAQKDPVMQALHQLEIYPGTVGQRLSNQALTEQQWADYATKAGKLFYLNAENKVNDPSWGKMDADEQANIIWETIDDSRRQAQAYMHMTYPNLAKDAGKQALDNVRTNGE